MFWRGSYEEYLHAGPPWQLFGLMATVALLLSWIIGVRILPCALVVGSSFPAVILGRVLLDNPTDHNLWPFELALATVIGMIVAFPPAGIGWIILHRLTGTRLD